MSFEVLTKDEAAGRARISRQFLGALVRSDVLQAWLEALTAQQQGQKPPAT